MKISGGPGMLDEKYLIRLIVNMIRLPMPFKILKETVFFRLCMKFRKKAPNYIQTKIKVVR